MRGGATRKASGRVRRSRPRAHGMGYACCRCMQLVPNEMPAERLIISMDAEENEPTEEISDSPFVLKGAGVFSGNGGWIYIGLFAGAFLFSVIGFIFVRHVKDDERSPFPMFVKAGIHHLAASPNSVATPAPVIVQLSADMVRVTAIALGHPRLAVINNKPVAEGDTIIVHAPTRSVALTLRIVKISDGRIDMSDGTQVFTAQLTVPPPTRATPH
jgi:hypothetical protein